MSVSSLGSFSVFGGGSEAGSFFLSSAGDTNTLYICMDKNPNFVIFSHFVDEYYRVSSNFLKV